MSGWSRSWTRLAAKWRSLSPKGRVWWEPWELRLARSSPASERVKPEGFGLALHCNIAEVMATLPVDRWLKNTAALARQRNIPVIVEYWLGGPSEELEPFYHLAHPLVTLRGLKAIAAVPGVSGIKEYFGLNPTVEDPNLRMTGLFFRHPAISEADALKALAKPYGKAAGGMIEFWHLASQGMELFPWDTSWFIREVGRSRDRSQPVRRHAARPAMPHAELVLHPPRDLHEDGQQPARSLDVGGRSTPLPIGGGPLGDRPRSRRAIRGLCPRSAARALSRGTWRTWPACAAGPWPTRSICAKPTLPRVLRKPSN